MKRYFILALAALAFGLMSGYLGTIITHIDSDVFSGFSMAGHWYDYLVLFEVPGDAITWKIYNPSDSYLGDDSAYWLPIIIFNGLFWMVAVPVFSFYLYLAKCLWRDLKSAYQKRFCR